MDHKAPSGLTRGPSTWATAVHETNVRTGTSLKFNKNLDNLAKYVKTVLLPKY